MFKLSVAPKKSPPIKRIYRLYCDMEQSDLLYEGQTCETFSENEQTFFDIHKTTWDIKFPSSIWTVEWLEDNINE